MRTHSFVQWHWIGTLALSMAFACGGRNLGDPMDDAQDPDSAEASDPGVRPGSRGSMYSACSDTSVCTPHEFCVFPQGEAGYCSAACGPGDDITTCDLAPGEDRDPSCMDIGLPDGRTVCALGCASLTCPGGMRCEEVQSASGAQFACF